MTSLRRVLMTADTVGGVWTYALELSGALVRSGVDVTLATMGRRMSLAQHRATAARGLRVCESAYRLEWMEHPWEDLACAGRWLLELERDFQPDVVHLNAFAHGSLPWRAPVLVVGHSCVMTWWQAVKREAAPAGFDAYRHAVRRGLAGAGLVAAPTQAMLDGLEAYYGPLRHSRVIPNGRSRGAGAVGRRRKKPYVFSAARLWDEAKNIAALAKVAPSLPWPVYVAGDCTHPGGGTVAFEGVHALGSLDPGDLDSWLECASIFALPARYEPFGQSALEAAMSGCALVLGDIGSLREVWDGAATFVAPDDAEGLRRAISELVADKPLRERMGELAWRRSQAFSNARMLTNYLCAYESLIGQRALAEVP